MVDRNSRKSACAIALAGLAIIVLWAKPFDTDTKQALVLAAVLATIGCWTLDLCNKAIPSAILVLVLLLIRAAPAERVLAFPLSSTFLMILLCYLFSRGISNSGLAKALIDPLLVRYGRTPLRLILLMILLLTVTIRIIPQPLVRLIMLAEIFTGFLDRTDVRPRQKQLLLFALFEFYILVNAGFLEADIILNTSAVGFAGLSMSGGEWIKFMLPPTAVYIAATLALFLWMYRKELRHVQIGMAGGGEASGPQPLAPRQKLLLAVVLATILLWVTRSFHGINENLVTLVSVALMFALGWLKPADLKSIDVSTLTFLTAAYAIGGAMTGSGTAQKMLSGAGTLFPAELSAGYILLIVVITMLLHFLLGSNTTALSVAIPGLLILCGGKLSPAALMFIAYISLVPHHLLPFHCIGMAIGEGNGYFKGDLIARFGLPMMGMIVAAVFGLYLPWWRLLGLL